ncbi:hypothetical protein MMH89_00330 [Candidatus Comchoanobacter bicostacola]|uniref:Uncharacterized protein n=1 Tax=Candidatus Comchoanobacter bicostacola TaxID=2919598 RepID=A0ABY5DLG5_9GAMM|nr:hypothetical protein [Candidatus Comchoanobacter bicostacola]UTC24612.1 hypothetical protein MMH89_00330 [Candidatus Comchoanobacter bicostacola]
MRPYTIARGCINWLYQLFQGEDSTIDCCQCSEYMDLVTTSSDILGSDALCMILPNYKKWAQGEPCCYECPRNRSKEANAGTEYVSLTQKTP